MDLMKPQNEILQRMALQDDNVKLKYNDQRIVTNSSADVG